jgi:hypothetical protein
MSAEEKRLVYSSAGMFMNAGVKIGHRAPLGRSFAAE